jgi:exopolysaccharide production protein ExoZ
MTATLSSQRKQAPGKVMMFFPSVQYLRAVAALMVVMYHVVHHWLPETDIHHYVLMGGVDVFFVISGFVMWGVTAGREGGSWSFFSKRLKRIVPLYWIITTVMAAIVAVKPALLNTRFDIAHMIASYLFIPWRHPVKGVYQPLVIPGWTLNYEMAFYVIFALILFAPIRFRLPAVVAVLVGMVALGHLPHMSTGPIGFYTDPIILEFAMGVCLGVAVRTQRRIPVPISVTAIVVGVSVFILTGIKGYLFHRAIMIGIPATLVVGGCVFLEREKSPWLARIPLLLGDASYSIYLVHMSSALIAYKAWQKIGMLHNLPGVITTMVAATIAAASSGVVVYWYVERPIVNYFKVPAPESKSLTAS